MLTTMAAFSAPFSCAELSGARGSPARYPGSSARAIVRRKPCRNVRTRHQRARGVCCNALDAGSAASIFDPALFAPVCSTSDALYRVLQSGALSLVGPDAYNEYSPLIAAALLRVRLEMCVLESFFSEAILPFIQRNGLSWVLPLHETVETFVAGTVFAVAVNFVLLGSTKVLTVVVTYIDVFIGWPLRATSGFFIDRLDGKPLIRLPDLPKIQAPWDLGEAKQREDGGASSEDAKREMERLASKVQQYERRPDVVYSLFVVTKLGGDIGRAARKTVEALDLFVGRYLVLLTVAYVAIKFVHFKVWPDFP